MILDCIKNRWCWEYEEFIEAIDGVGGNRFV